MIAIAFGCTIGFLALIAWLYSINWPRCIDGTHEFEPRYSEESMPPKLEYNQPHFLLTSTIEALTAHKKTYIHDVCIYCGKIAKAESAFAARTKDYSGPEVTTTGSKS